jgi:hypothetical protein
MGDYVKSWRVSFFFLFFSFFRWFIIKEPWKGAVVSASSAPFFVRVPPYSLIEIASHVCFGFSPRYICVIKACRHKLFLFV